VVLMWMLMVLVTFIRSFTGRMRMLVSLRGMGTNLTVYPSRQKLWSSTAIIKTAIRLVVRR